ncbi:TonB-dependent receptor [Pedobacter sp. Du54]|uniref:SusC/RagA family TonB-linked outer membrane protein n=1 Tax=Pedobacter anseongensis TaxID=3133439 RepID=UPI0030A4C260
MKYYLLFRIRGSLVITLILFLSHDLIAQTPISVKGQVTNEQKIPLPGVTVSVKNGNVITQTSADGSYIINVPSNGALIFNYLGFRSTEILVDSRNTLNVTMVSDTASLNEVVVVGYGSRSKATLTGAITTVNESTFQDRPITNTLNGLQGVVPGLTVTRSSGAPGRENYAFEIRGASSINGNNPLVLIDGIVGDMSSLNPNDIKSISVLKDASAAIYGARAADGVVLVTTKSGNNEKLSVTYTSNLALKVPSFLKKSTTTPQLYEMYNEASKNAGNPQPFTESDLEKARANDPNPSPVGKILYLESYPLFYTTTNWNDILYGTNPQQNHNITVGGGNDNLQYYFSGGYLTTNGVYKVGNNKSDRYNLRSNLNFKISNKLNLETRFSYEGLNTTEPSMQDFTLNWTVRLFKFAPVYTPSGNYYRYQGFVNPLQLISEGGRRESTNDKILTNFKLNYDIVKGLKLVTQAGINVLRSDDNANYRFFQSYNYDDTLNPDVINNPNSASYDNSKNIYKNFTGYLDYNTTINKNHDFNLMVGSSYEQSDFSNVYAAGRNFISNDLFTLNLADKSNIANISNNSNAFGFALNSYFSRFGYSFKGKYLIDATARIDGSSRFSPDKRWSAVFPAVSLAWRLSEEDFVKKLNVFNNLKLRGSWGLSGNQEINAFGYYDYIQLINVGGRYPFGTTNTPTTSASLAGFASPSRTWEEIESRNIGVDMAFFRSKFELSFDYFTKENKNMLVNITLPATLGANPPASNAGRLKTKGFELSMGLRDKIGQFQYGVRGNVSNNTNKLTYLGGQDAYNAGFVNTREGYPLASYFGYVSDGIIKTQAQLDEYKKLQGIPGNLGIGDVMYRDLDGDGSITAFGDRTKGLSGDMKYLGSPRPQWSYGFNLDLAFKQFDFSLFAQGIGKRDVIRVGEFSYPFTQPYWQPLEYFYNKTWDPARPDAELGRLNFDAGLNSWNYRPSTLQLINTSYLRLKNIQLGYNFSPKMLNKFKISTLRLYLSGQDIFEFSKGTWDKSYDPEENATENGYPFYRTFSFGLNVKF